MGGEKLYSRRVDVHRDLYNLPEMRPKVEQMNLDLVRDEVAKLGGTIILMEEPTWMPWSFEMKPPWWKFWAKPTSVSMMRLWIQAWYLPKVVSAA